MEDRSHDGELAGAPLQHTLKCSGYFKVGYKRCRSAWSWSDRRHGSMCPDRCARGVGRRRPCSSWVSIGSGAIEGPMNERQAYGTDTACSSMKQQCRAPTSSPGHASTQCWDKQDIKPLRPLKTTFLRTLNMKTLQKHGNSCLVPQCDLLFLCSCA